MNGINTIIAFRIPLIMSIWETSDNIEGAAPASPKVIVLMLS